MTMAYQNEAIIPASKMPVRFPGIPGWARTGIRDFAVVFVRTGFFSCLGLAELGEGRYHWALLRVVGSYAASESFTLRPILPLILNCWD
jgi:hypothetical protein